MGKLQFIHTVRAPKHFSSGRSQYQSYISSNFTISSACALQAFICRTHSIWFSAFSCSVTPFCFASNRMISSMRFCAASSILSQYCLTYTQLYVRGGYFAYSFPLIGEAMDKRRAACGGGSFGAGYLVMFSTKRWRIAATWARVALARGRSLPSVPLTSFSATAQESGAFA